MDDWLQITARFMDLGAPPPDTSAFFAWLERWNQLDIEVYDHWTRIKRRAYTNTADPALEDAYATYSREVFSTYHALTMRLVAQVLKAHPRAPTPTHRQLWRRWTNQAALYRLESLPLHAEISELESRYRALMRRLEGVPGDPLQHWLAERDSLNELMLRLVRVRTELARISGYATFLEYRWRELNRLDYRIEDAQAFHRAVEEIVVPAVAAVRDRLEPASWPALETDAESMLGQTERVLGQIDPELGAIFAAMRASGHVDLGPRLGKADTSEQWFFPREGLPHLHVSWMGPATVLHESGHAMHEFLSFKAQGSLWNFSGSEEWQEFVAMTMDQLAQPFYALERGGFFTAEAAHATRQSVLQYFMDALVNDTMQDAFEHWVYTQDPDTLTSDALDAHWLALKARFQPWEQSDARDALAQTGWQRWAWSLYRIPLYIIAYPFGIVGTCLFTQALESRRNEAIGQYKAALTVGNTEGLPSLFARVGVRFPFTEDDVRQALEWILERRTMRASPSS